ncbi:CoA ester lyase [Erythrobacter litoralis]|nr:CoA ester lyase [Erythrobacter litoralis]
MRSLLFVPGDSERKIAKATSVGADALILDLEDSVASNAKSVARKTAADLLSLEDRPTSIWVRVNSLDTKDAMHDLVAIVPHKPDGIVLPKATPREVEVLANYLTALEAAAGLDTTTTPILAVGGETASSLFDFGNFGGLQRLLAITWGAEDFANSLSSSKNRDCHGEFLDPFKLARSLCLAGSRAAGVAAIETVDPNFRDLTQFESSARAAGNLGFDGMLAIHPDQVPVINRVFDKSKVDVGWATKVVDLFNANPNAGALSLDGKMIDIVHLKAARKILDSQEG